MIISPGPLHPFIHDSSMTNSGTDYFDVVTMRHLLGQSSGYGTVAPGSKMTYDSDTFIQVGAVQWCEVGDELDC